MLIMNSKISELRTSYKPAKIEVLFVAESPPESNDREVRFFYNARQESYDVMYRSLMKTVFPEYQYKSGEKDSWLRKFQGEGCYLIDATDTPLNQKSSADRNKALRDALVGKISEINGLIALSTPVVLIKKNVFAVFNQPLRDAGHNVIHDTFLPFPSHGHQPRFIKACGNCYLEARGGNRTLR